MPPARYARLAGWTLRAARKAYRANGREQRNRFRRSLALAGALSAAVLSGFHTNLIPTSVSEVAGLQAPQVVDTLATEQVERAARPLRDIARGARELMPRLAIVLVLLATAAIVARLARPVLHRLLRHWERAEAVTALVILGLWVLAIAASLSVLVGDVRVLVGSVGLVGLALSWSLQSPIESFTGWLLNSFRGYYRVGDRISVGDVFGDVYAIDMLTTTVWEAGDPTKPVAAAQPTGALITFPNSEVLRTNIVNFTRAFPYVWDELTIGITNESDVHRAAQLCADTALQVLGETMSLPASTYQAMLREHQLDLDISIEPRVFVVLRNGWTDLTIRYLVPTRERRTWSSALAVAINDAVNAPEHRSSIQFAVPRRHVELMRKPE